MRPEANVQSNVWARSRAPIALTLFSTTVLLFLAISSPDLGLLAGGLLVVLTTIVLLVFLVARRGRVRVVCLALIVFYLVLSWLLLRSAESVRSEVRWLSPRDSWKAEVLAQRDCPGSALRFVRWDGWGALGANTDVYLVYSPDDRLRDYSPANLAGLPTSVWHVQRLESKWYAVTFYTNDWWQGCDSTSERAR